VAQILEKVILPRPTRPDHPNRDEATSEFLRDEFIEGELEAWVDGDGWWDDLAVVVDRERIIGCVGVSRGLRDARVVGIIEDVQACGDRTPGIAADVGNLHSSLVVLFYVAVSSR
jgi:hypothetical protein